LDLNILFYPPSVSLILVTHKPIKYLQSVCLFM